MMPLFFQKSIVLSCLLAFIAPNALFTQEHKLGTLPPPRKLTIIQTKIASANYQKYCSLCHGADRQGHVNDHAPSLRSKSLFESGVPHAILRPMSYGRTGTAMGDWQMRNRLVLPINLLIYLPLLLQNYFYLFVNLPHW